MDGSGTRHSTVRGVEDRKDSFKDGATEEDPDKDFRSCKSFCVCPRRFSRKVINRESGRVSTSRVILRSLGTLYHPLPLLPLDPRVPRYRTEPPFHPMNRDSMMG